MNKYKIIIFDIGKTLFDKNTSKKTSELNLDIIKKLRSKGIKVGVCTMRTIKHCKEVVPTDLDFYISLNGSFILCDNKVIFDNPMELIANRSSFITYDIDKSFYSDEKARIEGIKNGFLIDDKGIANKIYSQVFFNIEKNNLSDFEKYTYEYWPSTKALALQHKESSKTIGIKKVLDHYNFKEPILYFGDGPNDLEIFRTYKDCICMGNCYFELEKYALFKTKEVDDNGIEFALTKLGIL